MLNNFLTNYKNRNQIISVYFGNTKDKIDRVVGYIVSFDEENILVKSYRNRDVDYLIRVENINYIRVDEEESDL